MPRALDSSSTVRSNNRDEFDCRFYPHYKTGMVGARDCVKFVFYGVKWSICLLRVDDNSE